MNDLHIFSTNQTTEVTLHVNDHLVQISGVSRPVEVQNLYIMLLECIVDHKDKLCDGVSCNFHFENNIHVNSLKMILKILNRLVSFTGNKDKVVIIWNYYSDEQEIKGIGGALSQILNMHFKMRIVRRAQILRKEYHRQSSRLRPCHILN